MYKKPGYSMHSTDSESQSDIVPSTSRGLDRCAQLLSTMLDNNADDGAKKSTGPKTITRAKPIKSGKSKKTVNQAKRKAGIVKQGRQQNVDKEGFRVPLPVPSKRAKNPPRTTVFNTRLPSSTPEPSEACVKPKQPAIAVHQKTFPVQFQIPERDGDKTHKTTHNETGTSGATYCETRQPVYPGTSGATYCEPRTFPRQPVYPGTKARDEACDNHRNGVIQNSMMNNIASHGGIERHNVHIQTSFDIPEPSAMSCDPEKQNIPSVWSWQLLKYHLQELTRISIGQPDVIRLVDLIRKGVVSLEKVHVTDTQTDINLALQPLRSENCQLRRKLRIANQQLKEKEIQDLEKQTPSSTFERVHLLASHKVLQQELQDERGKGQRLLAEVTDLRQEIEQLSADRESFMRILKEKDEHIAKVADDWQTDITRLQRVLREQEQNAEETAHHHLVLEDNTRLLQSQLLEKDLETKQLQSLVSELQQSMNTLKSDLQRGQLAGRSHPDPQRARMLQSYIKKLANLDQSSVSQRTLTEESLKQHDKHSSHEGTPVNNYGLSSSHDERHARSRDKHFAYNGQDSATHQSHDRVRGHTDYRSTLFDQQPTETFPSNKHDVQNGSHDLEYQRPLIEGNAQINVNNDIAGIAMTTSPASIQNQVYKSTVLDTSLSTIDRDRESVETQSILSITAPSTLSTVSTVNDVKFRAGLQSLDNQISQLQETLRYTRMANM